MVNQFKRRSKKAKPISISQKLKRGKNTPMTSQYKEACDIRSSTRWTKLSNYIRRKYPICQYCNTYPSQEVHHIKSLTKFPEKAYEVDNLLSMCIRCHNWIEARNKRGEDTETQIRERLNER
jgi:5-methylcytosine-specific restriction endonuclease McrA